MRLRAWLARPQLWPWAALLGLLMAAPTLELGLLVDDHLLRANLGGDPRLPELHTAPWDAFHFFPEGARDAAGIDLGFGAWWQQPGGFARAFRALPSLTHWLEFQAGAPAWFMHLHSALWYAALCAVVAVLYRRMLVGWAAGLAALFFAVDYSHAMVVGWVANRNALLAATFGVAAVLLHHHRRVVLAALCFAAALASGEVGLGFAGYLFAHVVCLEPRGHRVRALVPYVVVGAVWLAIYVTGSFGTRGSGMYLDPRRASFWLEFPSHLVLVLATELGGPGPDFWPLVGLGPRAALVLVGVVVVSLAVAALLPVLRQDARARFLGLGALLASVPVCATTPSARLALVPGIGLIGLVGLAFARWRDERPKLPRVAAVFAGLAGGMHLFVAPLLFPVMVQQVAGIEGVVQRLVARVPDEPALASQQVVVVNLPDLLFTLYVRPALASQAPTRAVPRGILVLGLGTHSLEVERLDARTLRVVDGAGFFGHDFSVLFRPKELPMPAGSEVVTPTVHVFVEAMGQGGVPTQVRFEFSRELEDRSLRWLAWDGSALVPFVLPAVGTRVTLSGRVHPLLAPP